MRHQAAKALIPFALVCVLVPSIGIRDVAKGFPHSAPPEIAASPDSTAQSLETVRERPEYDPDIYDEDTTIYAAAPRRLEIDRTPRRSAA